MINILAPKSPRYTILKKSSKCSFCNTWEDMELNEISKKIQIKFNGKERKSPLIQDNLDSQVQVEYTDILKNPSNAL